MLQLQLHLRQHLSQRLNTSLVASGLLSMVMTTSEETLDASPESGERPGLVAPHLFVVSECERPCELSIRVRLDLFDRIVMGRGVARSCRETGERTLTVQVPDGRMSATHAILTSTPEGWLIEDAGSRNGTFVDGIRRARAILGVHGDLIELGRTCFLFRAALPVEENANAVEQAATRIEEAPVWLITLLPSLARQLRALPDAARSTAPLVIMGETGTGKELIARAVHALSGRKGEFVAVNCGALPETLVETELFGYRKGAFSGANEDRQGLIRAADGGTLFLDEIGDLPLASQAAFLRVLQENEVTPVGSTKAQQVNIRVVAATHRNLEALVERRGFRADLLARVSGFTVRLPPLRERREDLGLLVAALLRRLAPDHADQITFTLKAMRALMRYEWPFNIRELEKALQTGIVRANNKRIGLEHLPEALHSPADPSRATVKSDGDSRRREELVVLLREHRGNVSAVARALGVARMQVQRWIKRLRLDPAGFRGAKGTEGGANG